MFYNNNNNNNNNLYGDRERERGRGHSKNIAEPACFVIERGNNSFTDPQQIIFSVFCFLLSVSLSLKGDTHTVYWPMW